MTWYCIPYLKPCCHVFHIRNKLRLSISFTKPSAPSHYWYSFFPIKGVAQPLIKVDIIPSTISGNDSVSTCWRTFQRLLQVLRVYKREWYPHRSSLAVEPVWLDRFKNRCRPTLHLLRWGDIVMRQRLRRCMWLRWPCWLCSTWCAWCAGRPPGNRLGQSLGQAGRRLGWGLVWNSGTNGRGMGWVAYRLRRGLGPAGCCWRKRLGWSSWWSWWSVCPRSHSC